MTPAQALADLYRVVSTDARQTPTKLQGTEADFEALLDAVEALEWYADRAHYRRIRCDGGDLVRLVEIDWGHKAREALGEKP